MRNTQFAICFHTDRAAANVRMAMARKRAKAPHLAYFRGRRSMTQRPANTTGTLASIIPSVVPVMTQKVSLYLAARTTVAICVLSPISARKNRTSVVKNIA
jgi:hypothetical protein